MEEKRLLEEICKEMKDKSRLPQQEEACRDTPRKVLDKLIKEKEKQEKTDSFSSEAVEEDSSTPRPSPIDPPTSNQTPSLY